MEQQVLIELHYLLLGVILACVLFGLLIIFKLARRVKQLTQLEYEIQMPPVPHSIIEQIRSAEVNYYSGTSRLRKLIEQGQDLITLLFPGLVFRLNFSIGRMRMKPRTINELIPWALEKGYLKIFTPQNKKHAHLLSYFAMQPFTSKWQAAVLISHLRELHPLLRNFDWEAIEKDTRLVQKLYSGYMGAGGDWNTWKNTLEPGKEAIRRFMTIKK